jgi:glycogen debranching enzyme
MKPLPFFLVLLLIVFVNCKKVEIVDFKQQSIDIPPIEGKPEYLNSPYVTSGNRVYMVGHQDGSFPELGWHIKGEMGGIWDHPIKLMDGFEAELIINGSLKKLEKSDAFTNFPTANFHSYNLNTLNLNIERWQFVPDHKEGIVVQYILENTGKDAQEFQFKFTGQSDLRPTWLGERTQMVDGEDEANYISEMDVWQITDTNNPWSVVFGADIKSNSNASEAYSYSGNGVSRSLTYPISLASKEKKIINVVISGSYISNEASLSSFKDILTNFNRYFSEKQSRYKALAEKSKLIIPDKNIQQAFEWLKYNCDWLVQTVPEIGTGITAGIPDYPWWFGVDSEYALKGYMAIGQKDAVYSTIKLLDSVSNALNGNGRIIHEMSSNGAVFNPGNINETPQFASLVWEIYKWNGDLSFLKTYFPTIKKGLEWLMTENDANKNLFPDGFGMMEIHGMDSEMIDVAVYTQRAFEDASKIATELGEEELSEKYADLAAELITKINAEFWSKEFNSYADFIGTDAQALKLIEDAIVRADTLNKPWAIEELKKTKQQILAQPSNQLKPFVLHHNWVVNTPMEMGIADPEKAEKALKTAESFVNPFGVFVTGIDRDESAGTDEGSFKGSTSFSYTGAVMTLPTSVLTIAENNYGNPDKALNYIKRMTKSFSYAFPGSMYEVSPDYGMITQAWTIYGYAIPIIKQFFGIQPMASKKTVTILPQMPTEWNNASLENVEMADNTVSMFYNRSNTEVDLKVVQTNTNWTLDIVISKTDFKNYEVDQNQVVIEDLGETVRFKTNLSEFNLKLIK